MRVLVLDEDFAEYQVLLGEAGIAAEAGQDPAAFKGPVDVLLAQPALAAQYLAAGNRVQWIQSTWAGIDALMPAARDSDAVITGVKGIFGQQMAEYVLAYLLAKSRSLAFYQREQAGQRWSPRRPGSLAGLSMAILGTGTIGRHIAGVAASFGMTLLGVSRSGQVLAEFDRVWPVAERLTAVAGAQVLVNTLPSTSGTRGLIDRSLLDALAPDATVFNLGRGDALCEPDLKDWLEDRLQSRAGLDVFACEPLPEGHWLWSHPRVQVTPHVAAVSFPVDVAAIFLDNLQRWQQGQVLRHVVDPQRGY